MCAIKDPPSPGIEDSKIILPPKENFPPQKPERTRLLLEVTSPTRPYLPPREYCDYYVARFFEEVHCIYWLYPIEQFHARLDDTYVTGSGAAASSWLCSLYAIFALGAASNENSQNPLINDFVPSETRWIPDAKTSESYLALAKALIPAVHDEADIDSIRALAIFVIDTLQYCKNQHANINHRVWLCSPSDFESLHIYIWERECKLRFHLDFNMINHPQIKVQSRSR